MKVLIDAVGIRGHGGAAILEELLRLLPEIRKQWEINVTLLTDKLREFEVEPQNNVNYYFTSLGDSGVGRLLWINFALPRYAKKVKADVVFSFANIGSFLPKIVQVVLVHQPNIFMHKKEHSFIQKARLKLLKYSIYLGLKSSAAIIVQTNSMKEQVAKLGPSISKRIHIIPSGYRGTYDDAEIREEKKALLDMLSGPKLIYVTHPGSFKNHEAIIKALPRIAEKYPGVKLILTVEREKFPSGPYKKQSDDIYRNAKEQGVSDKVVWAGILNKSEVQYFLKKADLSVFPSLSESFGLALVESMAMGCPLAVADLPYARDVCGNAANYFNPQDSVDMAEKILAILGDDTLKAVARRNTIKQLEKYQYDNICQQIALLLEAVAETASESGEEI